MKYILVITTIFLLLWFIGSNIANSQDELKGMLVVDFEKETAIYTEHHEFEEDVVVSAFIPKSECNSCLDYMTINDCQKWFKICLDVK